MLLNQEIDKVIKAKAELASLLMSAKARNMTTEMYLEELRNAIDWHIVSVTPLDGSSLTKNEGTCKEFHAHFQKFFTREPSLTNIYIEATSCRLHIRGENLESIEEGQKE